jgi:hypothetical protein
MPFSLKVLHNALGYLLGALCISFRVNLLLARRENVLDDLVGGGQRVYHLKLINPWLGGQANGELAQALSIEFALDLSPFSPRIELDIALVTHPSFHLRGGVIISIPLINRATKVLGFGLRSR